MNSFQALPGRSRPYSSPVGDAELWIAAVLLPLPTHTAALTCGVYPTIQASLFCPTADAGAPLDASIPTVPVFDADTRPPARATPENSATGSSVSVTSLATRESMTGLGASLWTNTVAPWESVTDWMK